VLIVGAGASGLAAAARIKEETNGGLDVTVVECRDQVGGRVQTEMFEGLPVQRGATWLNPGHPTFELYKQSGLKSALDDFLNASLFQISCMVPPTTPAQSSAETVPTELSPTNTPSTAPSVMPAMAPTVARRRLRMEQKKRIDSLVDEFEKDESLSETKKELTRRFLRKLSASGFSQDAVRTKIS
jgi:phytoene dehydrogenase-like protein